MLASQVKNNADVIMISVTKLDDIFPVGQFAQEEMDFKLFLQSPQNQLLLTFGSHQTNYGYSYL